MSEAKSKYDDIINTEWNEASLKNRMSPAARAKIFLPFSALAGYQDELDKTLDKVIARTETVPSCWSSSEDCAT